MFFRLPGFLIAAALVLSPAIRASGLADRVVLLANKNDPDSLAIARHYAQVRGVPEANILALPMSDQETITWPEFVSTIWNPLKAKLVSSGWIDGVPQDSKDEVGRRIYAVSGQRMVALVTCRGVPLRIDNDLEVLAKDTTFKGNAALRTNQASVDSELSLLAWPAYSVTGYVPNPLFHKGRMTVAEKAQVVEVSRLDGPTAADALALVDRAVAGEKFGLLGQAYVDVGGPDPEGDRWLEAAVKCLTSFGWSPEVDRSPTTFPASARFDAPAIYAGWYSENLNGPFALPGFRFPPGAIALPIHSFSAHTLRSDSVGWSGPLVARGVTATAGNVFEPYLQLVHRPNDFLEALCRGLNLVDSAYYALPALSWQSVLIGDPLYRPFVVPLGRQLADYENLPSDLDGYAVIRWMTILESQNRSYDAILAGRQGFKKSRNAALGLALADRLAELGDEEEGVALLKAAALPDESNASNWVLTAQIADYLAGHGSSAAAVNVYRTLFTAAISPQLKRTWLMDASKAASAVGETGQAEKWSAEARSLP